MTMIAAFQSIVLTLISYPVLIFFVGILIIYRNIINVLLIIKLGKKYGGFLPTNDSFFCLEDLSKINIISVLIFKSDKKLNMLNFLRTALRTKVFNCPDHYPKLTGTMHSFSGYRYLIKNNCTLDECVRSIELTKNDTLNEEYLKVLLSSINSKPFPHHNTGLWEFITSEVPLKGNYGDKHYRYPIIVKFHHAVGNGTSLISFLIKVLGDEKTDIYMPNLFGQEKTENNTYFKTLNIQCNKIKKYLKNAICVVFMGVGRFIQFHALEPRIQFHPIPCGEKIVSWTVENNVTFLPIVKRIKNRVPGAKFSDVILTAVSASMSTFFINNFQQLPDSVLVMLPTLLEYPKLHGAKPVTLENTTSASFFHMPLIKTKSLLETLENISAKKNDLRYDDIIVAAGFPKVVGLFPTNIIKEGMKNTAQLCLLSNVPGCSQIYSTDGCVIEKIIALAPNTYMGGISFTILTYDDRLQLGILVDKSVISSQEVIQKLVDDVFHYLKLLDLESENIYG